MYKDIEQNYEQIYVPKVYKMVESNSSSISRAFEQDGASYNSLAMESIFENVKIHLLILLDSHIYGYNLYGYK